MWEAFKRELVEHILTMADNPAFVEHARYRVRELREQDPALFGDLPEMLTEAMKEKNGEQNRLASAGADAGRLPGVVPVVREQA